MQVREIMTRNPQWVSPQATLQEAAQQMQQQNIGSLMVGENDRLTGFITDRDIAINAVAKGSNPTQAQVNEAMNNKVLYCYDDQKAEWAANNMHENQITRLIVLNREKRLQGVITHGDIARAVQSNNAQTAELGTQVTELAAQQVNVHSNQNVA